jgi:hypothetical protein
LFGYHVDSGNTFWWGCQWFYEWWCFPHFGDSEFVLEELVYNSTTEHWVLNAMFTSAHWGGLGNPRESLWWYESEGDIQYPAARTGWYPRVFVARDKHANYATRSACNSGMSGSDDCEDNDDDIRFDVDPYGNIGSWDTQFQDTVYSRYQNYGGVEYFWQDYAFCGWDEDSLPFRGQCCDPYMNLPYSPSPS